MRKQAKWDCDILITSNKNEILLSIQRILLYLLYFNERTSPVLSKECQDRIIFSKVLRELLNWILAYEQFTSFVRYFAKALVSILCIVWFLLKYISLFLCVLILNFLHTICFSVGIVQRFFGNGWNINRKYLMNTGFNMSQFFWIKMVIVYKVDTTSVFLKMCISNL